MSVAKWILLKNIKSNYLKILTLMDGSRSDGRNGEFPDD